MATIRPRKVRAILGVTDQAIRNLVQRGLLTAYPSLSHARHSRYSEAEVTALAATRAAEVEARREWQEAAARAAELRRRYESLRLGTRAAR